MDDRHPQKALDGDARLIRNFSAKAREMQSMTDHDDENVRKFDELDRLLNDRICRCSQLQPVLIWQVLEEVSGRSRHE
jgi:hypothetical protein